MRDPETGGPHTAHTTNPVPIVLLGAGNRALMAEGRLADIAPTLLELMDLPKPAEMTGTSLLREIDSAGTGLEHCRSRLERQHDLADPRARLDDLVCAAGPPPAAAPGRSAPSACLRRRP